MDFAIIYMSKGTIKKLVYNVFFYKYDTQVWSDKIGVYNYTMPFIM